MYTDTQSFIFNTIFSFNPVLSILLFCFYALRRAYQIRFITSKDSFTFIRIFQERSSPRFPIFLGTMFPRTIVFLERFSDFILSCLEKIRPIPLIRTIFCRFLLLLWELSFLLSIVVVVPLFFACILYPASKITIIIINKCPYPLGPVSKFGLITTIHVLALPSTPANSNAVNVPCVTSVTVYCNSQYFRRTINKTNWILLGPSIWSQFYYCGPKSVTYLPILQPSLYKRS